MSMFFRPTLHIWVYDQEKEKRRRGKRGEGGRGEEDKEQEDKEDYEDQKDYNKEEDHEEQEEGEEEEEKKEEEDEEVKQEEEEEEEGKKHINGTHFIAVVPRGFNSTISVSNIGLSKLSLNLFFIFFEIPSTYCILYNKVISYKIVDISHLLHGVAIFLLTIPNRRN